MSIIEFRKKPIVTCHCCDTEYYSLEHLTKLERKGDGLGLDWYDCSCGSTITVPQKQETDGISELEANILRNQKKKDRLAFLRKKNNDSVKRTVLKKK